MRFHDRVPVDQIPHLIEQAHIGIVPCKKDIFVDKVMLPVRLLEYVAMNLPTIISRVGTVESYFSDDEVAYYPHDDAKALADQIIDLHQNPHKCQMQVEKAKQAFQNHTWERQKERYYAVIDALLGRDTQTKTTDSVILQHNNMKNTLEKINT